MKQDQVTPYWRPRNMTPEEHFNYRLDQIVKEAVNDLVERVDKIIRDNQAGVPKQWQRLDCREDTFRPPYKITPYRPQDGAHS